MSKQISSTAAMPIAYVLLRILCPELADGPGDPRSAVRSTNGQWIMAVSTSLHRLMRTG